VETSRLHLVPWSDADTPAIAAMNEDAEVMRFIGGGRPSSPAESEFVSARIVSHWERFGFGLWAVKRLGSPQTIGFAGLCHPLWLQGEEHEVEVGWRFTREAWGHGYATEAAHAALEVGFAQLELPHIVSYIDPANVRSQRVSTRLGMHLERAVAQPSRMRDILVWSIRRDQWRAAATTARA
jgi:RimJ/RimL family protein N-acetyltransferase